MKGEGRALAKRARAAGRAWRPGEDLVQIGRRLTRAGALVGGKVQPSGLPLAGLLRDLTREEHRRLWHLFRG